MRSGGGIATFEALHQPRQNGNDQPDPENIQHHRDENKSQGWFSRCHRQCGEPVEPNGGAIGKRAVSILQAEAESLRTAEGFTLLSASGATGYTATRDTCQIKGKQMKPIRILITAAITLLFNSITFASGPHGTQAGWAIDDSGNVLITDAVAD